MYRDFYDVSPSETSLLLIALSLLHLAEVPRASGCCPAWLMLLMKDISLKMLVTVGTGCKILDAGYCLTEVTIPFLSQVARNEQSCPCVNYSSSFWTFREGGGPICAPI